MVTAYLEFAELQAMRRRPMYMKDWIIKLDDFLRVTDSNILDNRGAISHSDAKKKAEAEYEKYKKKKINEISKVEEDFIKEIDAAEKSIKKITEKSK